jgi:hypothetical protein
MKGRRDPLGGSLDRRKTEVRSNDVCVCIEGGDIAAELRRIVFPYVLIDRVELDGKGVDIGLRRGRPRLPEETPSSDDGFAGRSEYGLRGQPVR